MATKKEQAIEPEQNENAIKNSLVIPIKREKKENSEPTARIFIPQIESDGSVLVDQFEHVTIANEAGEPSVTRIHRGEWVDVPWNVFIQLKEKYPKL